MTAALALPWNDEAEQSVLGALLQDNRTWDRIGDTLVDGDFYSVQHRTIFAGIMRLLSACKPADVVTVADEIQRRGDVEAAGGMAYLNALAQAVPSAANARRYAEIVRRLSVQRALIAVADEALATAREQDDPSAALDKITTLFGGMERGQLRQVPRLISEVAVERLEHYTAVEEGSVAPGWPTGFPALDARLNGGLRPGSLYILAARPAVGKSSFAQGIGLALAGESLPTLFCGMEMEAGELGDRGISSAGRVSYSALLTGRLNVDDWSRVAEAAQHLARLPFYIDDQPALTLRQIRMKAKSIKGLKVLVIDYLQLMASTRRDGNRNSEIEEISRGLKALAKELQIAVIALSQLNRDVDKRPGQRPRLSDLRDSGAIEQDADVVMFLWEVRELAAEGRNIVCLGIDKNRQGRLGDVGLDFYGDTQRWEQSTADIRPQPAARGRGDDL